MILGASYAPSVGRVFIIGSGRQIEASPTSTQIALAFGRVRGEQVRPWVSIEPIAGALEGPAMNVVMSDDISGTDFGWVMLEADRRLKSYALGYDNVTGYALTFGAKGFLNRIQLSHGDKAGDSGGFQRFWLHPRDDSRAVASPTQVRIESGGIRIATEGLRAEGGRLVQAAERKDPLADRFADFVTRNYAELASEEPSFLRLEQLRRLLVVAEWARKFEIPISLDWIASQANAKFPILAQTPALRVEAQQSETTTVREGNTTRVVEKRILLSALGGASLQEFTPGFVTSNASEPELMPAKEALAFAPNQTRRFEHQGRQFVAIAIPTASASSKRRLETLFNIPLSKATLRLASRPAEAADRPARVGVDKVVALPVLRAANPLDGREETMGIEGRPDSLVLQRRYELYGADAVLIGSFTKHEVDQTRQSIRVRDSAAASPYRIYPQGMRKDSKGNPLPGAAAVVGWDDGAFRIFDVESGLLLREQYGEDVVDYVRDNQGLLQKLVLGRDGGSPRTLVEFDLDSAGNVLVSAQRPGQESVALSRSAQPPQSKVFAKFGITSAVARQAEADALMCPTLVTQGAVTLLVHGKGVEALPVSGRSAGDLLAAVRDALRNVQDLEAKQTVVVDAQNDVAGTLCVLMRNSHGELVFDELPEQAPRQRRQGKAALDAYHALMGQIVKRAAIDGRRFMYWGRSGERLRVFAGVEVIDIPFSSATSPNHATLAVMVKEHAPILLQQCLELEPSTVPLAVAMRRRYLENGRDVYLARDVPLAIRNEKRQNQLKQPGELTVSIFPNFNTARVLEETAKRTTGSGLRYVEPNAVDTKPGMRGNRGEGAVLVLYGHNDSSMQDQLTKLGQQGKLRERTLLSVTCNEPNNGQRVSELIAKSGAIGITNSLVRVDPTLLNPVTAELGGIAQSLIDHPISSESVLRIAIDRALQNPNNQRDRELMQKLKELRDNLFLQISMNHLNGSKVNHA